MTGLSTETMQRLIPLLALSGFIALAYAFGLQDCFTLKSLAENHFVVTDFVQRHLLLSMLIYVGLYILATALSLPVAGALSIICGLLFGVALGAPITVFAATIGAVIVFQIVRTSLGRTIADRAGPFVNKLSDGFAKDSFNYLLFLRLVPVFPFFAVNAVAGLTKVDLRVFILGTVLGIIPGSIVFIWFGQSLSGVIDAQMAIHSACVATKSAAACPFEISTDSLITPQLFLALCAFGILPLAAVLLKRLKVFG